MVARQHNRGLQKCPQKALNVAQLRTAETLYGAELDSVLLKQIERNYPHLREYPKRLKKMGRIMIK
jgi:hypothetical protein